MHSSSHHQSNRSPSSRLRTARPLTVAIVEDEYLVRVHLRDMVSELGHTV